MSDPIVRLATLNLIKASVEIEAEISRKVPGWFLEVYIRFRDRAAENLAALAFVEADKIEDVRALQNRVKFFDEFVTEVRSIVNEGLTADREFSEEDRQEILDNIMNQDEGERASLEAATGQIQPPD
jgi:hypothetical protein